MLQKRQSLSVTGLGQVGTEAADKQLQELMDTIRSLFGETEVAGGRGIYLYPPGQQCLCCMRHMTQSNLTGGFHEWHTNRDQVSGWYVHVLLMGNDDCFAL